MTFFMPNIPNLPFGLSDPPMQKMNPAPWENPGEDEDIQDMNELTAPYDEQWGLFTQGDDPQPVFDVDTCIEFNFGDTSKISDFPVEQGAFASYNKVLHAFQPKIKLMVGSSKDGSTSSQDRIQALLDKLYQEVRSTNLYDLYMPEYFYEGVTVEKYNFKRTASKGRGSLEVDVTLMQVIQVSPQSTTVQLPKPKPKKAADGTNGGKQQEVKQTSGDALAADYQKRGQDPSTKGLQKSSDGHWYGNSAGKGSH
jgi:hypothetical protein